MPNELLDMVFKDVNQDDHQNVAFLRLVCEHSADIGIIYLFDNAHLFFKSSQFEQIRRIERWKKIILQEGMEDESNFLIIWLGHSIEQTAQINKFYVLNDQVVKTRYKTLTKFVKEAQIHNFRLPFGLLEINAAKDLFELRKNH